MAIHGWYVKIPTGVMDVTKALLLKHNPFACTKLYRDKTIVVSTLHIVEKGIQVNGKFG